MEIMADVSWWQLPGTIPWAMLKENFGISRVAVKASMGGGFDARCDGHCEDVIRDGLKLELYHWIDPSQSWATQAVYFINKINKHEPDKINFDIEQYWADWAKPNASGPRLSVAQMRDSARIVIEKVQAETGYGPDRARGYSATWFVEGYCMELVPFLQTKALWWAYYVMARAFVRATWPELYYYTKADGNKAPASKYKLSVEQFRVLVQYLDANKYKLPMPKGLSVDQVLAYQFDSKIQPSGCPVNIDLSLVYDSDPEPGPEPEPEPGPEPEPEPEPEPGPEPEPEPEPEPDLVQVELGRETCQVVYDAAGRALGKVLT